MHGTGNIRHLAYPCTLINKRLKISRTHYQFTWVISCCTCIIQSLIMSQGATLSKLTNGYNSGYREPESYNNVYRRVSSEEVGLESPGSSYGIFNII